MELVTDPRTPEQLREHYEIEKQLADRLRNAPATQRAQLYPEVYNDLFRRVTHHPQLAMKKDPERSGRMVRGKLRLIERYLRPEHTFLEIGAGDCTLSIAVAPKARQVYALDVSEAITSGSARPSNFQLVLTTGCDIPLPDNSVDLAYSDQVMEHIHPDDAASQLAEIHRVLRPGGAYLCITPNRLSGPHDISRHFDDIASGFHLREYSIGDLAALFQQAGFSRIWVDKNLKFTYLRMPPAPFHMVERLLEALPAGTRRSISRTRLMERILYLTMVGKK
jgi:SAM-dependent methyltransferase